MTDRPRTHRVRRHVFLATFATVAAVIGALVFGADETAIVPLAFFLGPSYLLALPWSYVVPPTESLWLGLVASLVSMWLNVAVHLLLVRRRTETPRASNESVHARS